MEDALREPITNEALAGIRLGDSESQILAALGTPRTVQDVRNLEGVPTMAAFDWGSVGIALSADRRAQHLAALSGYQGRGPFGIHVGMKWNELTSATPVAFEEEQLVWRVSGYDQIEIELEELGRWGSIKHPLVWHEVSRPDRTRISSIGVQVRPPPIDVTAAFRRGDLKLDDQGSLTAHSSQGE